ncbi:MFS transporter [Paraburkholderia sp. MPAMCS5]|uniref:MFS transporter n=1 Tax=Paraburkholderia sp. MPAMCS5 TaxID=3112563 RepID=UPI002E180824|nr:MFS transporter [Paraburkholderia sp. MPAMCS5]
MFTGRLADRFGHRKILIPAAIAFSLLAGASGLATGVGSLILIRALMGFAEGAYAPSSITATLDASSPERHGQNVGIQQTALPLFGLGIAPILVTQLLKVMPWHWIFAMVSLPGLVICFFTWKLLRDIPPGVAALHTETHDCASHKSHDVLRYRNVPLNVVGMLCWLTCLIVLSALLPNYLIDFLHLSLQQMGFVLSAIGAGGTLGSLTMPALSDRIGRKPVMVLCVLGAFVSLYLLSRTGPNPALLFAFLMATIFFVFSMIMLTRRTDQRRGRAGDIDDDGVRSGERHRRDFWRRIAPAVAGFVAKHFGIQYIMQLGMGALAIGLIVAVSLKETAPARLKTVATPAALSR